MKNIKFITSVFIVIIFVYFCSCSNTDVEQKLPDDDIPTLSLQERYQSCKDLSKLHSDGLDAAYSALLADSRTGSSSRLRSVSNGSNNIEEIAKIAGASITEFLSQEQAQATITDFNRKVKLQQPSGTNLLKSSGDKMDNSNVLSLFDNTVGSLTEFSAVEQSIEETMYSDEFTALSEEEQNQLLLIFALFDDSSEYWTENSDNWNALFAGGNGQSGFEPIVTVSNSIVKADAIGGGVGAIGGAIGGGIAGAIGGVFFGGAGAIPGAISGAVLGAIRGGIAGAIGASMYAYLNARQYVFPPEKEILVIFDDVIIEELVDGQIVQRASNGEFLKVSERQLVPLSSIELLELLDMSVNQN